MQAVCNKIQSLVRIKFFVNIEVNLNADITCSVYLEPWQLLRFEKVAVQNLYFTEKYHNLIVLVLFFQIPTVAKCQYELCILLNF